MYGDLISAILERLKSKSIEALAAGQRVRGKSTLTLYH
jgi:hypothetical protein